MRLNWMGIQVSNLEESIAFYRDALGLRFEEAGEDYAVLFTVDGFKIELLAGGMRSVEPRLWVGVNARMPGFAVIDLPSVAAQLVARGVRFVAPIVTQDWGRSTYFVDPDGNQWELYERGEFEAD